MLTFFLIARRYYFSKCGDITFRSVEILLFEVWRYYSPKCGDVSLVGA